MSNRLNFTDAIALNKGTGKDMSFPYLPIAATTVANLPSASVAGAGARATVSNANAPTFGATVSGGGSTVVPVYSDGTNWKVG